MRRSSLLSSRNVFSDEARLREVVADLAVRGIISSGAASTEEPLGWLIESGEVDTLVEAAYRYGACTEGVTAVMTSTTDPDHLEQNVRSLAKGPLPAEAVAGLERDFGVIAEPIGN